MAHIDPEIWMPDPDTIVPSTVEGLSIVVCSTVHVLLIHIPKGYSESAIDVGAVDVIEKIMKCSIPSYESSSLACMA